MCGRFAIATSQQVLAITFDATPIPDALAPSPSWNIAPSHWAPILTATPPVGVDGPAPAHLRPMQWGLLPSWSDDVRGPHGRRPINARAETVGEKRMFSGLLASRRCLVPASGWYEWLSTPVGKVPQWLHPLDEEPLTFAGLWTSWAGTEGSAVESFTILTCDAAPHLAEVHNRMPVLIAPEDRSRWLGGDSVTDLLQTARVHAQAADIDHHPVSNRVNSTNADDARLIEPIQTLF